MHNRGVIDLDKLDRDADTFGYNGNRGCDVLDGSYSCGAWHKTRDKVQLEDGKLGILSSGSPLMSKWAGKWQGGRFTLDELGRKTFFIERRVAGRQRAIKLRVHEEFAAIAELSRFIDNPEAYCRPAERDDLTPVYITQDLLVRYLESIRHTVHDHRKARASYLTDWAKASLDLKTAPRVVLRSALDTFPGGYRGRVEALNAFGRWLVKEGTLPSWRPVINHRDFDPELARAQREAYSLTQLAECYLRLPPTGVRDVFLLRASTGMHQTEIDQIARAKVRDGPLPDTGIWIRTLPSGHEIAGVLQVQHKSRHRHRQSLTAAGLAATLRLQRNGVPKRGSVWKAMSPLVPSNLRHTFITLAGECGELVSVGAAGVDRGRVAQAVGHRAGSTMTADRYEKLQVPPMIRLPLSFP